VARSKRKIPAAQGEPKSTTKEKHREELLDEALDETFPASDPVAMIEPAPRPAGEEDQ